MKDIDWSGASPAPATAELDSSSPAGSQVNLAIHSMTDRANNVGQASGRASGLLVLRAAELGPTRPSANPYLPCSPDKHNPRVRCQSSYWQTFSFSSRAGGLS